MTPRPKRPTRTVSKLLVNTYAALGQGYIQPTLLEIWENSGSGEAVAAEAFVALECAARDVTQNKRMSFAQLENTEPDLMRVLFERAIEITESRLRLKAGAP